MKWDFTAATAEELAGGIVPALLRTPPTGRVSKTEGGERIQLVRLLHSVARTTLLDYPLSIAHTSQAIPDCQLLSGNRQIGVELTQAHFQDLSAARSIPGRERYGALSITGLLPEPGKPRKRPERIRDGFDLPAMVFPPSLDEERRIWLAQARISLDAKTKVLARPTFVHGDEDWLVVLDPVGEEPAELATLRTDFASLLSAYWSATWYSRVFLQDYDHRWQIMFTQREIQDLPV